MITEQVELFEESALPARRASSTVLGWILAVGGAVGLIASFVLAVERNMQLEDPTYVPSCSFNPLVSCGSVMDSWQGSIFGFSNPLLGIAAFAGVTLLGVVVLTGAQLPRWFWLGVLAGTFLGVVFITWLFIQSVYLIGALCPYCMVVWAATIPIFTYTAGYVVSEGHLGGSRPTRNAIVANRGLITAMWFLVITALIIIEFWDQWYLVF